MGEPGNEAITDGIPLPQGLDASVIQAIESPYDNVVKVSSSERLRNRLHGLVASADTSRQVA